MALELTIKAFTQQKTDEFQQTHDLFTLYDKVEEHIGLVSREYLKLMPRWQKLANGRYGLDFDPELALTMKAYEAAISFISEVSTLFERNISVGGMRVLIKKAPWISFLPPP